MSFKEVKLKYIATLNPSKSELNLAAFKNKAVSFLPMDKIISPNNLDLSLEKTVEEVYSGYTYFRENDIVLAKVTPCFENGNIAVAKELKNGIGFGTTELHVIRVDEQLYDKEYIYYCLQLENFKAEAVANMYGVGGLKRIPTEFLSEYKFLVPDLKTQVAIRKYLNLKLTEISSLIENKNKLIKLLEQQRQSIITEAVTKGLNPNVKMKDSGVEWIGEIPEHWASLTFRRVTNLQQGLQIAQEERFYEDGLNRYEYITVKSLNYQHHVKEYVENPSIRVICEENDVLLARTGATGLVITGVNGVFHNNFFKVNYDSRKVCKEYLVYYLKQLKIQEHFQLVAGTTTIPDLNHGSFYDTALVLPNLTEQAKIVDYLNSTLIDIDKMKYKVVEQVEKLKEYRQVLIYEAVTGKIDVREMELD